MSPRARNFVQMVVALCMGMMVAVELLSSQATSLAISDSLVSSSSHALPSARQRFVRQVRDYREECSQNMPCMWAVCDWSVYVVVKPGKCDFIKSVCKCARGQRCLDTRNVSPSKAYLTVTYTCR